MKSTQVTRMSKHLTLALVLALAVVALAGDARTVTAGHANLPPTGMVCTTDPNDTFTLTAKDGYISIPDGNIVYMWGFSAGDAPFQHPSPVLCVDEGDTVTIVLHNTLAEDVSIIFPGQEDVLANGLPSQPVFAGTDLVSLAPVAGANGGSVTYSFVANNPGTYIYESGTEPAKQINMGLYGALVVRPTLDATLPTTDPFTGDPIAYAYNDAGAAFNPSTEYLLLISEIDPMLHVAVEQGYLYDMNSYTPRYWMYNGRAFPDTVASNGADWLSNQPYGALVYIHPFDDQPFLADGVTPNQNYNPYPALIRHLNVGTMDYSHHPHGNHGRVIAWDGHLLQGSAGEDMSLEEFSVTIGAGQTMESLFQWTDVEKWDPVTNPIPVVIPQLTDLAVGQFYSGSPYLGNIENLPVGTQALNQCGEYYHIAHNHALHQITAWGVVLSGHITFARIDPPYPNTCAP